jgi:hypothetical protein
VIILLEEHLGLVRSVADLETIGVGVTVQVKVINDFAGNFWSGDVISIIPIVETSGGKSELRVNCDDVVSLVPEVVLGNVAVINDEEVSCQLEEQEVLTWELFKLGLNDPDLKFLHLGANLDYVYHFNLEGRIVVEGREEVQVVPRLHDRWRIVKE